jgi:hypothetical protein
MNNRALGTTTLQIWNAPVGSVFIWIAAQTLWYPQEIANLLGRGDLTIISPGMLHVMNPGDRRSMRFVVDHACHLTAKERALVNALSL